MGEDCPHCVFEKTEANCPGCFEGSHYRPKPITNYDRLRAMSMEEMANEFAKIEGDPYNGATIGFWLNWLKQEVSTNG